MKVTECLSVEHGVFLTQLAVLERLLAEAVPEGELRAAFAPVGAAVEQHRDIEEQLLFAAIAREMGEGFPPLAVMQAEHVEIERCIREAAARQGDVRGLVRAFIDVLRQHIWKEDHVLFPLAEQRLASEELERLAGQCAEAHHGGGPCGCGHPH